MVHVLEILMATHHGAMYLPDQLDSILNQSYQNFRLIIRDDNSRDGTVDILNTYQSRYPDTIEIVANDSAPLGAMANFSTLMSISRAPYVMLADQDDIWLQDKVIRYLERIQELEQRKGPRCPLLVHGDMVVVNEELRQMASSFWAYAGIKPRRTQINFLLMQNVVTGCACIMNRALLHRSLPIPPEAVMHDHWLALVASLFGKIGILKAPLVRYRQHANNALGARQYERGDLVNRVWRVLRIPRIESLLVRNVAQAEALYNRYHHELDGKTRRLLKAFMQFNDHRGWPRRKLIIRNRFFLNQIRKTMGLLWRC